MGRGHAPLHENARRRIAALPGGEERAREESAGVSPLHDLFSLHLRAGLLIG